MSTRIADFLRRLVARLRGRNENAVSARVVVPALPLTRLDIRRALNAATVAAKSGGGRKPNFEV